MRPKSAETEQGRIYLKRL